MDQVRIDRWLWAARFFKTRSLAKSAIEGGKITVEQARAKPSKEIRVGQSIEIRKGETLFFVVVTALAEKRGSAAIAQTLYRETGESVEAREAFQANKRMQRAGLRVPDTKPSKKQRRDLRKLKAQREPIPSKQHSQATDPRDDFEPR
ncbi:MAG: ribosome-associated heat shock protein Hsp15 [Candidatus Azotimanducaceae bacterium]|jgi:ribosome-associated heat shock protein Hsp15